MITGAKLGVEVRSLMQPIVIGAFDGAFRTRNSALQRRVFQLILVVPKRREPFKNEGIVVILHILLVVLAVKCVLFLRPFVQKHVLSTLGVVSGRADIEQGMTWR